MKVIGLVGGTSWISSVDYYRLFNEITNQRLGGNEAAKIVLYSVNYGEIVTYTHQGNWDAIAAIIAVQQSVKVPLLHIADVVGKAITEKHLKKVALLGTKYTMLFDFYTRKLADYGIETIIPDAEGVDFVNSAIYNELGKGKFLPETKQGFLQLIDKLAGQGAEGVILGCTEIPMLVKQEDTLVPVFDTTLLHATAAVDFALQ